MSNYTRGDFLQIAARSKMALFLLAGLSITALSFSTTAKCQEPDRRKPNIVFILADDLGYECLRCNGGTSYQTPNLDSLAATGLRFTRCYSTPTCTPSRVQVMTGQYPFRNDWAFNMGSKAREQMVINCQMANFAHVLKSAGYTTAVAGKWQLARLDDHPNHATECGFDDHCLWTWSYQDKLQSRYWKPFIWENGKLKMEVQKDDVFGPDVYTDFIVDFIRRNKEKPFFVYFPMTLPHKPLVQTPDNKK